MLPRIQLATMTSCIANMTVIIFTSRLIKKQSEIEKYRFPQTIYGYISYTIVSINILLSLCEFVGIVARSVIKEGSAMSALSSGYKALRICSVQNSVNGINVYLLPGMMACTL